MSALTPLVPFSSTPFSVVRSRLTCRLEGSYSSAGTSAQPRLVPAERGLGARKVQAGAPNFRPQDRDTRAYFGTRITDRDVRVASTGRKNDFLLPNRPSAVAEDRDLLLL
jgi:hypothetical protein